MVTAILLCRRICIAKRGCTSSAASSEPHVLRVPCTVIVGTLAATMHRVEAAVEVSRLDRGAMPGGEDQSRFDPGRASAGTVSILLSPADLERSNAQTGQRQGRF